MIPYMIVDDEILDADWFPPKEFLGSTVPSQWQEHAIVILWSVLAIGYLLFMAPILLVSLFFWLVAVEWSLESTLRFSSEELDAEDEQQPSAGRTTTKNGKAKVPTLATKSDHDRAPPLIHADVHE
jgi:hypothetical protein